MKRLTKPGAVVSRKLITALAIAAAWLIMGSAAGVRAETGPASQAQVDALMEKPEALAHEYSALMEELGDRAEVDGTLVRIPADIKPRIDALLIRFDPAWDTVEAALAPWGGGPVHDTCEQSKKTIADLHATDNGVIAEILTTPVDPAGNNFKLYSEMTLTLGMGIGTLHSHQSLAATNCMLYLDPIGALKAMGAGSPLHQRHP